MTTPSNTDDIIDSRDVIARIEELEGERVDLADDLQDVVDRLGELLAEPTERHVTQEWKDRHAALKAEQESAKARITEWDAENGEELFVLRELRDEACCSPDWEHGETLVREDHFVEYTKQLIDDCYEFPKEMKAGDWPWRHITIDYEAAAEEAKQDYFEVDFGGVTYLIRA